MYEQSLKDIMQMNSEIAIQMKNTLEVDLTDDTLQDEVYNKIKEMINNTTKIDEPTNSKWLQELRLHLSKNLLTFLDIIFKQINLEKNYASQKFKWQSTLDQISLSHDEELNKSNYFLL
jgi:AraC-like DNA-binding protein